MLEHAGGSVKTAIVMARRGVGREEAERLLEQPRRPAAHDRGRPSAGPLRVTERPTLAVGLMSGTSLDGMDAALVRLHGPTHAELIDFVTRPYADDERAESAGGAEPAATRPRWRGSHVRLADWAAEAVETLLAQAQVPASDLGLIAFHGQTIWHEPPLVTWQLGEAGGARRAVRRPGGEQLPGARPGRGRAGRAARADGGRAALRRARRAARAAQPGRDGQPHLRAAAGRGGRACWRSIPARASQ